MVIPVLEKGKQEGDLDFKVSLGYIARPCFIKKKKKQYSDTYSISLRTLLCRKYIHFDIRWRILSFIKDTG
jgi:hypothetical protein